LKDTPTRVTWLMAIMATALLMLGGQLYLLTGTQSAAYRTQAEQNMLRELPNYGPRGVILDRNGRPLATSEPAFAAVLTNQDPEHVAQFLPKLALLLAQGDADKAREIETRVTRQVAENKKAWRQYEPLTVQPKLDQQVVTNFMERRQEFPGVMLVEQSARNYPNGQLAGSLLGYVGQIGEELKEPDFAGYHVDEVVGKAGLEAYYEKQLRSQPGHNSVVVDPWGRPVGGYDVTPPTPGNNLHLTLDLDLQRVAEEALSRQIEWIKSLKDPHANPTRGALVVQDVKTGAILAMASVPNYDPNMMVRGLTTSQWDALQKQPGALVNWGIQGFAPGSTYKMATGLAGLEGGAIGPYELLPCPANYWRFQNPHNWKPYDDGPQDIAKALATSCNPFFWETGYRLGIDGIAKFVAQFGFGKKSGIDLPDESPGSLPTQASYGDRWYPGEVLNVSIGQGDVLVTPLQLASYTATIAARGTRMKPYLVDEVVSQSGKVVMKQQPEVLGTVKASPESWQRLHDGMRAAVVSDYGTAYAPFLGFPIKVGGKTGSAETSTGYPHGLSVAFAPYDDPQIAVSVIIEGGSTGSWSTPAIRRVMAKYFGINDVIPEGVPTYDAGVKPAQP
jgi:penicillin-binding protein 2